MEYVGRTVLHKPIIGEITYIHNQGSTSNTWVITHDLHRFPSVTVVDTANNIILGKVIYNSDKQLTITFFQKGAAYALQGKAYLN